MPYDSLGDLGDTLIPRYSTLLRYPTKSIGTFTRTTSNPIITRYEFLATYRAVVRWASTILALAKNKPSNLRLSNLEVLLGVAVFAEQNKVIITIIKMVSIFMMHFKVTMAFTFLAANISSFYKFLQGVRIRIVKFILFPVRVVPA